MSKKGLEQIEQKQEKTLRERAFERVVSREVETTCFPAGEGLPGVDLTECEFVPVEGNPEIYAIVSHEQTGSVGYTRNRDLVKDVKAGEMFSDDFYEK